MTILIPHWGNLQYYRKNIVQREGKLYSWQRNKEVRKKKEGSSLVYFLPKTSSFFPSQSEIIIWIFWETSALQEGLLPLSMWSSSTCLSDLCLIRPRQEHLSEVLAVQLGVDAGLKSKVSGARGSSGDTTAEQRPTSAKLGWLCPLWHAASSHTLFFFWGGWGILKLNDKGKQHSSS